MSADGVDLRLVAECILMGAEGAEGLRLTTLGFRSCPVGCRRCMEGRAPEDLAGVALICRDRRGVLLLSVRFVLECGTFTE